MDITLNNYTDLNTVMSAGVTPFMTSFPKVSGFGCDVTPLDPFKAQMCQIDYIGHGFVIIIICVVGILMNLLNLMVLRSPALGESCYIYLSRLAIADLLSLFFFGTNSIGRGHHPESPGWTLYEIYVYFPLCSISTVVSVVLTVTVSVERYIYIYKPHKAKVWCQPRIARKVSWIIVGVSVLISIHKFFIFTVSDQGDLTYTAFGKSTLYSITAWAYFVIVSLGACVILIIINILLIIGIHRSNARRRCLTGNRAHRAFEERRLTVTLVSIICVFIIGELPSSFVSRLLLVPMAGEEILGTLGYRIAANVATGLVVLQHSLNFVMYCVFNKKFWVAFKEVLCACAYDRMDKKGSSGAVINASQSEARTFSNGNVVELSVFPVAKTPTQATGNDVLLTTEVCVTNGISNSVSVNSL